MRIVILNGSPHRNGNTSAHIDALLRGVSENHEVIKLPVGMMQVKPCMGCNYCQEKGNGICVIKDEMTKVYDALSEADMVIFASPVHYYGFSGQLQAALSRFYAITRPKKATKYALLLSSVDEDAAEAVIRQYEKLMEYFGAESAGVFFAHGDKNQSPRFLEELERFGRKL